MEEEKNKRRGGESTDGEVTQKGWCVKVGIFSLLAPELPSAQQARQPPPLYLTPFLYCGLDS